MVNLMADWYGARKAAETPPNLEMQMQQRIKKNLATSQRELMQKLAERLDRDQRTGQSTLLPGQAAEYERLQQQFTETAPQTEQAAAQQILAQQGVETKQEEKVKGDGSKESRTTLTSQDGDQIQITQKTPYQEQVQQMANYQPQVNLQPLAQLVDTWTGSRMAQGFQDPNQYQMNMMKQRMAAAREAEMYPLQREALKAKIAADRARASKQPKKPKQIDFVTRLNNISKDQDLKYSDIIEGLQKRVGSGEIKNPGPIITEIMRGRGPGHTKRLVNLLTMRRINNLRKDGVSEEQIEANLEEIHNATFQELGKAAGI